MNAAFGHQADFTPETYARLYELSGGDADTVVDLIDRLGWRAKQGRPVDSPAAYAVSVVRKVGIATLRAERIRRGGAPPVPNQPAAQTNGMAPTMNGAAPQPNVAPPVAPTFQAPAGFSWTSPEAAAVADHTRAAQ